MRLFRNTSPSPLMGEGRGEGEGDGTTGVHKPLTPTLSHKGRGSICCAIFVTLLLTLSACGFRPLYGNTNTLTGSDTSLDQITIGEIPGASGLMLKNALIDRFYHHGYPDHPPYVLNITLQENGRSIVIEKNDTTTRSQLVMGAIYDLVDRRTRKVIDHGTIRAVSSYNNLPSQYTTVVTQNDARSMTLRELADKVTLRMAVVLEKQPQ